MTASEARNNWFRVLDEVSEGETFIFVCKGVRFTLQCEQSMKRRTQTKSYKQLIRAVEDSDDADTWGWE